MKVLVLNGPNLNLLGSREPAIYGSQTLADIEQQLQQQAADHNAQVRCQQSNHEGELVSMIQQAAQDNIDAIIINPGAYAHTSVAIRDALLAVALPFYEVHLSNPHAREPFRHHSYLADIARGVISGCGALGYHLALTAALTHCRAASQ